jgi:hypothetical protein
MPQTGIYLLTYTEINVLFYMYVLYVCICTHKNIIQAQ